MRCSTLALGHFLLQDSGAGIEKGTGKSGRETHGRERALMTSVGFEVGRGVQGWWCCGGGGYGGGWRLNGGDFERGRVEGRLRCWCG